MKGFWFAISAVWFILAVTSDNVTSAAIYGVVFVMYFVLGIVESK